MSYFKTSDYIRSELQVDPADFTYKFNHNGFTVFYRNHLIGGEQAHGGIITPDGLPGEIEEESVNPGVSEMFAKSMIQHLTEGWIPLYMAERIKRIQDEGV